MFKRHHHNKLLDRFQPDYAIVKLWTLRIWVQLIPEHKLDKTFGGDFPEFLALGLGVVPPNAAPEGSAPVPTIRRQMAQNLEVLENDQESGRLEDDYCRGLVPLSRALGLNEAEVAVLKFATAANVELVLKDTLSMLTELDRRYVFQLIATALGVSEDDVRAALSRQGILARSGILALRQREHYSGDRLFELLNDDLPALLVDPDTCLEDVLRTVVTQAAQPSLELSDFPHLQPQLNHTLSYLKDAHRNSRCGVNVLFYGPPGTGKSELARLVAKRLNVSLFEVSSKDGDGDPANTSERLRALMLAQACLKNAPNLLLFDEVEEVFQGEAFHFDKERTAKRKAWLNRQLESNEVPTIWVTNSVRELDPAYARRFDVVMEVPVPPRDQREKIILSQTGNALSAPVLRALSEHTQLSPAVVARAARVAQAPARTRAAKAAVPATLLNLVNQTLKVQGLPPVEEPRTSDLFNQYSLQHLNPDVPLDGLVSRLTQHPRGRFCLYGPPGTGKSAFVRWVAQQLNKPLLLRRASDLLSQWVGGNEKNLAQAFEQAKRDDAVLLIDEVDTFLQPRESAVRGWEVSMVNEMLTQMESFNGLLFATTNLMQGLDAAAMRRFDVKVHLRAPTAEQLHSLLGKVAKELTLDVPTLANCQPLAKLGITPGDVAAVVRRQALVPMGSTSELLEAIADEGSFKPGYTRQVVGFV